MADSTEAAASRPRTVLSRWPWILLVVIATLAGFWKERLNSIEGRIDYLHRFSAESAYQAANPATRYIADVQAALAERGIALTVVSMPYREDLYPDRESAASDLLDEPDFHTLSAWIGLQRLEQIGIPTIDLWEEFFGRAGEGDIYEEDLCHLQPPIEREIGKRVFERLEALGFLEENSRITILGECFASTFGEELMRYSTLADKEIEFQILRGSADRGRIANQMFRFDEVYLDGCDRVVWIVPYLLLRHDSFPPLVANPPPVGELTEHLVTLRITEGLDLNTREMKRKVEEMPYPNALAELGFEVVGDAFLPEAAEGKGILLGWAARNRVRAGLEHLKVGDEIRASLFEWNAYSAEKTEIVGEYFLKQLDDFERPRFWLQNWVEK